LPPVDRPPPASWEDTVASAKGSEPLARTTEVRYARAADSHLAYRVVEGDGDETRDVVPGTWRLYEVVA
jgi:hypothetical protein